MSKTPLSTSGLSRFGIGFPSSTRTSKPARRSSTGFAPGASIAVGNQGTKRCRAAALFEKVSLQADAAPGRARPFRRERPAPWPPRRSPGRLRLRPCRQHRLGHRADLEIVEKHLRLARTIQQVDDHPLEVGPIESDRPARRSPQDSRQSFDRGQHVNELELLPPVGLVEDRAGDHHKRRGLGLRVDVGGENDSAIDLNTSPVGSDEHTHAQVVGDGNLRRGVTHEELVAARGIKLKVLGEPAAVGGPLRPVVGLQVDRRVRVLALPARLGCLETVPQGSGVPAGFSSPPLETTSRPTSIPAVTTTSTKRRATIIGSRPPCPRTTRPSGPIS